MLKQRVITAVVLVALLLGALAWSARVFALLATLVVATALWEWLRLVGWSRGAATTLAALLGVALLAAGMLTPAAVAAATLPVALVAAVLWLGIALLLVQTDVMEIRIPRAVSSVLAVVLAAAAWLALLYFLYAGPVVLLSVLFVVWLADTAAYFAGRAFGRRKLAPHISPGKTWAGAVGAVVAVVAVAWATQRFLPAAPLFTNGLLAGLGLAGALLLAALVAVSIVGDLFESVLKRQAGVKDSSQLLPGHGGVYDRVDALLPALPFAVLLDWMAR